MTAVESGVRRILAVSALLIALLLPQVAAAADMDDCRADLRAVEAALPRGMQASTAEVLRAKLEEINALSDKAGLLANLEAIEAEYKAYLADPDPDGDGLATDPKVMDATTRLYVCLNLARAREVAAIGSDAEDAPAAGQDGGEPAADDPPDLSAPLQPIDQSSWFADVPYPIVALREERGGVVRYDLTVAADGSVKGCQASGPPASADLESATCDALLAKARFQPAKDATGRPVQAEISGTINWKIPD